MSIPGAVISFILIWWLCLFTVLPMRHKGVAEEPERHAKGADRGAPVDPAIWWKVKTTTLIAVPVWAIVALVIASGVFDPARG
ncbi:MAG: DUF1467 family protein [Pseudomonadota bacterium]